jgi:multicomponent Na+:H+ antiporter subunit A
MLMAVLFTLITKSRMAAIVALGVVGYGISLVYMIYGATDLAITQILTETLLMVLFVILVMHLPKITNYSGKVARLRDAIIAVVSGSFVTALLLTSGSGDTLSHVSAFYTDNSLPLAYGSNIVNVILVDFRALDTLGEITVIVIAAIGVVSLLKLKPKGGKS